MLKEISLVALFPPGSKLENEGLGRYLEALIAGSKSFEVDRQYGKVWLHVAPWHESWARKVVSGTPVSVKVQSQYNFTSLILCAWSLYRPSIFPLKFLEMKFIPKKKFKLAKCNWSDGTLRMQAFGPIGKFLQRKVAINYLLTIWKSFQDYSKLEDLKNKSFPFGILIRYDFRHKIFDKLYRRYCNNYFKKLGSKNLLVLMHNRLPVPNSKNVILLVPDLIPLEFSKLFTSESKRWDILVEEVKENCERGKKWITFSDYTVMYAKRNNIISTEHQIKVIRHASKPPGLKLDEFLIQERKGVKDPRLEYSWKTGQSRILPTTFRDHAFVGHLEYVFYPSQYRPHKGIESLILLWPRISTEFPNLKLVLTLDPVQNPKIQKLAKDLNLESTILFLPYLSDHELNAWTGRAKLILSFSRAEGAMPFMVSEAMVAKVPFLVRDLEVSREILSKGVQSVSFFNDNSAASMIIASLNNLEQLLNLQLDWYKEYSRTWTEVWQEFMQTLEGFSD
jgi:glycosyltransferase involved in cell wall biosynthesis